MTNSIDFHTLLYTHAPPFIQKVKSLLAAQYPLLPFAALSIDHICYRVESMKDYTRLKTALSAFSTLLIESIVGGRQISTFKLHTPILDGIDVLELPSPKAGSIYVSGFEHVEFVIPAGSSLEELVCAVTDAL